MDWTRGAIIGRGSTATVSIATSTSSGLKFAVKSAERSCSNFLQREQKILSSFKHHRVVRCMGSDMTTENNKLLYNLFMEYFPGGTLADLIMRKHVDGLPESLLRTFAYQIVEGLAYLHSFDHAHCDIKPTNILLGDDGVKIGDFGCARWVGKSGEVHMETASPVIISGTPRFMSPEAARGEEQRCPADVWALGCTIIEMATGRSPWLNIIDDTISTLYRVGFMNGSPAVPDHLSENARDFLGKCFRRDPRRRWRAVQLLKHPFLAGVMNEIREKEADKPVSTSPTSVLEWKRRCLLDDESASAAEEGSNSMRSTSTESPASRIKKLSACPHRAGWLMDRNWIMVRPE